MVSSFFGIPSDPRFIGTPFDVRLVGLSRSLLDPLITLVGAVKGILTSVAALVVAVRFESAANRRYDCLRRLDVGHA